jgi:hypothetical protein
MQFLKQAGAMAVRTGLVVCGGLMVLTAMSGTALAVDIGPEIDPTSIASAVTLFMGSVMMLTAKRRK